MRKSNRNTVLMALFLDVLILIFLTGCATNTLSEKAVPFGESQLVEESEKTAIYLYYDFEDVPVPKELEVKKEKSVIFQTAEFTAGLLTFSGKVESDSLTSFFSNKMPEDGWRFLSLFKSPIRMMFFVKENRFCIITITREARSAYVEILVTPNFQSGQ